MPMASAVLDSVCALSSRVLLLASEYGVSNEDPDVFRVRQGLTALLQPATAAANSSCNTRLGHVSISSDDDGGVLADPSSSCSVRGDAAAAAEAVPEYLAAAMQRVRTGACAVGVASVRFRAVPSTYYSQSLEERCALLGAPSIDHLCKTLVFENTHYAKAPADVPRYLAVVVQYTQRLGTDKLDRWFRKHFGDGLIARKAVRFRMAPPAVSATVTGYSHGAVSPFAMATPLPVVLSDPVLHLPGAEAAEIWMGAGHNDLKVAVRIADLIDKAGFIVVDLSAPETVM